MYDAAGTLTDAAVERQHTALIDPAIGLVAPKTAAKAAFSLGPEPMCSSEAAGVVSAVEKEGIYQQFDSATQRWLRLVRLGS